MSSGFIVRLSIPRLMTNLWLMNNLRDRRDRKVFIVIARLTPPHSHVIKHLDFSSQSLEVCLRKVYFSKRRKRHPTKMQKSIIFSSTLVSCYIFSNVLRHRFRELRQDIRSHFKGLE
jgi:hypothetical protein